MLNSLKRDAYKSIMVYEKDFSIERDGERIHSVPLLWKRICAYPSLQTKRTTTNLRDHLRELPSQINTLGIEKFNEAFKAGMEELQSRGKSIDDPDRICFDGFQKTIDDRFNKVFLQMEDDIDNEFGPYMDYTWEEICSKASEVYTRYKKDWGKKSEAEQQLDALKAEMERLAKEKKSLCDQLQELQAPTKDSADKKTKGKSNRSSDSKAADTAAGGKKDEAWRFDPPLLPRDTLTPRLSKERQAIGAPFTWLGVGIHRTTVSSASAALRGSNRTTRLASRLQPLPLLLNPPPTTRSPLVNMKRWQSWPP